VELPAIALWLKHSNHDEESQLNQTYQGKTWGVVSELEETHITLLRFAKYVEKILKNI